MIKLIENEELELVYQKGFGAWTHHIRIPNTMNIVGTWGTMKVSGTIDEVIVNNINLAPRKNEDKIISINKEIRRALGKKGGDKVLVTLFLHQ